QRPADGPLEDRGELEGRADPRRRPARQPPGGPPRRHRRGGRDSQGPSAVRAHHPHPLRAFSHRGAGDRPPGGRRDL
ncbi:MAG: Predicted ATPase related to phosphate starvation-inducible protein PhoH, partial [uncultured Thermomicrobiales bacterium]